MKRLFLSAVAFSAVAVGPALAADLPRKAPAYVPPAPPPYNWTGFYVGLNGGYSWGKATGDVQCSFPFPAFLLPTPACSASTAGFLRAI